jgi:hypothetical protein
VNTARSDTVSSTEWEGDRLVGQTGRVTVAVEPGHVGEVLLSVQGSAQAYSAISEGEDATIPVNARVVVIEQASSRTLVVAPC